MDSQFLTNIFQIEKTILQNVILQNYLSIIKKKSNKVNAEKTKVA